jgi:malonate-semialdehyde dehydrogenase (acetylating)/methylmalonate-semialdehyde dehydrogenase
MAADSTVQVPGFYVNGKWERPEGCVLGAVTNPATGATIAEAPYAGEADIDRAVRAAHGAFVKWREVAVVERVQPLYRYKALVVGDGSEAGVEMGPLVAAEH